MPRSKRPRQRYRGNKILRDYDRNQRVASTDVIEGQASPARRELVRSTGPRVAPRAPGGPGRYFVPVAAGTAVAGGGAYALHRRRRNQVMKSLIDPLSGETVVLEKRDWLAKADDDKASTGRRVAAGFLAPFHGAVAGRKGRKLRATGSEAAGSLGGNVAGGLLGGGLATLATRGKNPIASAGGSGLGRLAGMTAGVQAGVTHNQRRGNYKPEVGKSLTVPPQSASFSQGRTPEGPNVSHANDLNHKRHTPRRNETAKLVLIRRSGRSATGSTVGKMFSEAPARSGRRLTAV